MKRSFLYVICTLMSLTIWAQTNVEQTPAVSSSDGPASYSKFFSFGAKGGLSYFHVGPVCGFSDDLSYNVSFFGDYALNDNISLGLQVGRYSFNRSKMYGGANDIMPYMALNLSSLFSPMHQSSRFNFFLNLGAGYSLIHRTFCMANTPEIKEKDNYFVGNVGLEAEAGFGRNFSGFLSAEYRLYITSPNLNKYTGEGGMAMSNLFEKGPILHSASLSLGVRYRIPTKKANLSPTRPGQTTATSASAIGGTAAGNPVTININLNGTTAEGATVTYSNGQESSSNISIPASSSGEASNSSPAPAAEVAPQSTNAETTNASGFTSTEVSGVVKDYLKSKKVEDLELSGLSFDKKGQLTAGDKLLLDGIIDALRNNSSWNFADVTLLSDGHAKTQAASIAVYLKERGLANFKVKAVKVTEDISGPKLKLHISY